MTAPRVRFADAIGITDTADVLPLPLASGRPLTIRRLLEGERKPAPSLLVEQLLLRGDVNMFAGSGDAGKTTNMLHIAVCTTIGRPVYGTLAVTAPGAVVLIVPEDGEDVARHHVEALMEGMGLTEAERAIVERDLHIIGDDRPFNLLTDLAAFAELISEFHPVLVCADPLSSLTGGADEDKEKVSDAACHNLRHFVARPLNLAVLIAGHLRKPNRENAAAAADANDLKGSVGWSNHSRMVWTVSKPKGGNTITLRLVKSNRLPTGIEHHVTLAITANPDNAAHWLSCTLTDANIGAASQSLTPGVGRAINENERKALTALDDRLEPGRVLSNSKWYKESGIASENTFRSVKDRLLEHRLADLIPTGRMNPNGRSKTYNYAINETGRTALNIGWTTTSAPQGVKL